MYHVEDRDDRNSSVYDGCVYVGLVVQLGAEFMASRAGSDVEISFDDKDTAVEWIVAEYRDTPWEDRSVAARMVTN